MINLDEIEARASGAHANLRLLPTDEVDADPGVIENGCTIVARLGGLGVHGQPVWTIVGDLWPMARMGPYGDGTLFVASRSDIPALVAEVRRLREALGKAADGLTEAAYHLHESTKCLTDRDQERETRQCAYDTERARDGALEASK